MNWWSAQQRSKFTFAALALTLGLGGRAVAEVEAPPGGCHGVSSVLHQIVLKLDGTVPIKTLLDQVNISYPGTGVLLGVPQASLYLLCAPDGACDYDLILMLSDMDGVEAVEFNERGETSEGQTQSFFFAGVLNDFTDQYSWPLIGLPAAQKRALGQGTLVALIDTGLNTSHPLFATATILPACNFLIDGEGTDDVGDGIDNDGDEFVDELAGHGTFVAGLIHAMAPQAALLPLRAMDSDGHGTEFAVAAAIVEAMTQHADVINLSFVSAGSSLIVEKLIADAVAQGAIVVVAAGNAGNKAEAPFPATVPSVCAVAATDENDLVAGWSNVGEFVSLCAPGANVVSSLPAKNYAFANGTSLSVGLVSGGALLLRSIDRTLSATAVIETLRATAHPIDDMNPGLIGLVGGGRLDVAAAVAVTFAPADINRDGIIDGADLALVISAWGTPDGDVSGDGTTDEVDLGLLIGSWTR